jgi:hypothetical protein
METRVQKRFRYTEEAGGPRVEVNGEPVSDGDLRADYGGPHSLVRDAPSIGADATAAVEPSADGDVAVYSQGVFVKDVDGHGVEGAVVVRDALDVNFARNDIKSGCAVWKVVSSWLDDVREDALVSVPADRLSDAARAFLSRRMFDEGRLGDVPDAAIFRTVDGRRVSMYDVKSVGQFAFAPSTDHRARRLADGWNMMVLDEDDDATSRLRPHCKPEDGFGDEFDVDEKADSVSLPDTFEALGDSELNTIQSRKLAAARHLADAMGVGREVKWGESEAADAWTDGYDEIVLTDSAAPERSRAAWLPAVFNELVHQWSHDSDTKNGCDDDGYSFSRRFASRTLEHSDTLASFAAECESRGLREAVSHRHERLAK